MKKKKIENVSISNDKQRENRCRLNEKVFYEKVYLHRVIQSLRNSR